MSHPKGGGPTHPDDVFEIRTQYARGVSILDLSKRFGYDRNTVHRIVTGRTYAYLPGPTFPVGTTGPSRRSVWQADLGKLARAGAKAAATKRAKRDLERDIELVHAQQLSL